MRTKTRRSPAVETVPDRGAYGSPSEVRWAVTCVAAGAEMTADDLGLLQTRRCRWCRVRTPADRCHNCGGPR